MQQWPAENGRWSRSGRVYHGLVQAEHGGFYQAVATGIYRERGLEVTIKMGGPQTNGTQLLMGGVVDFMMGSGDSAILATAAGIPKITVAAIFQKHPGERTDKKSLSPDDR